MRRLSRVHVHIWTERSGHQWVIGLVGIDCVTVSKHVISIHFNTNGTGETISSWIYLFKNPFLVSNLGPDPLCDEQKSCGHALHQLPINFLIK